jgi:hypothetical protein
MTPAAGRHDPYAALRVGEIRLMLTASGLAGLANRALAVVVGYQVYALTKSPLMIGILGLVEAVPAIALSLYGGHVADRADRRAIILVARVVSMACAIAFAVNSLAGAEASILTLYGAVFVAGLARGFHDPAAIAFEAQVVPQHLTLNASSWFSTVWQGTAILGRRSAASPTISPARSRPMPAWQCCTPAPRSRSPASPGSRSRRRGRANRSSKASRSACASSSATRCSSARWRSISSPCCSAASWR